MLQFQPFLSGKRSVDDADLPRFLPFRGHCGTEGFAVRDITVLFTDLKARRLYTSGSAILTPTCRCSGISSISSTSPCGTRARSQDDRRCGDGGFPHPGDAVQAALECASRSSRSTEIGRSAISSSRSASIKAPRSRSRSTSGSIISDRPSTSLRGSSTLPTATRSSSPIVRQSGGIAEILAPTGSTRVPPNSKASADPCRLLRSRLRGVGQVPGVRARRRCIGDLDRHPVVGRLDMRRHLPAHAPRNRDRRAGW